MRALIAVTLAATVTATALAACGGSDTLSAKDYRGRLDTACATLADANADIPVRMRDEDLDVDDAERIAQDNGDAFEKTLRALQPPDELKSGHERLLRRGQEPPPTSDDPAAVRRWLLGWADAYRAVGAGGCEAAQRALAGQIPQAS
jgi:hypothetical protein